MLPGRSWYKLTICIQFEFTSTITNYVGRKNPTCTDLIDGASTRVKATLRCPDVRGPRYNTRASHVEHTTRIAHVSWRPPAIRERWPRHAHRVSRARAPSPRRAAHRVSRAQPEPRVRGSFCKVGDTSVVSSSSRRQPWDRPRIFLGGAKQPTQIPASAASPPGCWQYAKGIRVTEPFHHCRPRAAASTQSEAAHFISGQCTGSAGIAFAAAEKRR